jgi:hypothetical protein
VRRDDIICVLDFADNRVHQAAAILAKLDHARARPVDLARPRKR